MVLSTLTVTSASLVLLVQVVSEEAVSTMLGRMVGAAIETEVERTAETAAAGSSEAMTSRAAMTTVSSSSAIMPLKPSRYVMRTPR